MLHVPILRHGEPYTSIDQIDILHHATGEVVARISQANSGLIARDVACMDHNVLNRFPVGELIQHCRKAAELFASASLPLGETQQSFDDYLRQLSATTGLPINLCRSNAEKVRRVLAEMELVLAGLSRQLDPRVLDVGHQVVNGSVVSYHREAGVFGAVLPSNSPGVHTLWIPAYALKTPLVLKPGREEPWTPYRVIQALIAAGAPRAAFGFYPTDHAGAGELLRCVDKAMLFGDASTTKAWKNDPRVQLHGPGFSKVILGPDAANDWPRYLDVMESAIVANGGRSCLNASGVWTPSHAKEIAQALAERLARIEARSADDPNAKLAAFANPLVPEQISAAIDRDLQVEGAADVTLRIRHSPRHVRLGRCGYLLPTVIHCESREHPLANREFLFPFASVVECEVEPMSQAIGSTLVGTVISRDERFVAAMSATTNIDRLNLGAIPTWRVDWDQPHEGNLFEHLYRRRAFQVDHAA